MVRTAAFHVKVRGSFPSPGGLKETQMFPPHPLVKLSIVGSLVVCSASDLQGLNFSFCVRRAVSSHSSHHPQKVLLAKFSLYVHKRGLKPDSFFLHWMWYHQQFPPMYTSSEKWIFILWYWAWHGYSNQSDYCSKSCEKSDQSRNHVNTITSEVCTECT